MAAQGRNGRQVLIDSGFYRQKFVTQWKVREFRRPAAAVDDENLEKHVPITQTLCAASNLKAQDRIRTLASDPRLIVPGHDPAVFTRFSSNGDGSVAIR